jgi:hypothetical protein
VKPLERRQHQRLLVAQAASIPANLHALAVSVESALRDASSAWGFGRIGPDTLCPFVKCRYPSRVAAAIAALAEVVCPDGTPFLVWDSHWTVFYFPGSAIISPPRTLDVWLRRQHYATQLPECAVKAMILAELAPLEAPLREAEKRRRDEAAARRAAAEAPKRQQQLPGSAPSTVVRDLVREASGQMSTPRSQMPLTYQPLLDLFREILVGRPLPPASELALHGKHGIALGEWWARAHGNTDAWRLYLTRVVEQLDADDGRLHLGGEPVEPTLPNLLRQAVHEAVMARARRPAPTATHA